MLRKSKGSGYTLSINLNEEEYRTVIIWAAVTGGNPEENVKNMLLTIFKLDEQQRLLIEKLLK
jgi:hypothetical protein